MSHLKHILNALRHETLFINIYYQLCSIFQSLDAENDDKKLLQQLMRDQTVKDLTQKLSNLPLSPQEDKPNRVGDFSGLISKAKEELAKNKNKVDAKATIDDLKKPEPKKSEIEMHWEELIKNMDRDLILCDLDFKDLTEEDEINVLMPRGLIGSTIPPPPPPNGMIPNAPQSQASRMAPPFPVNGKLNGNSPKSSLDSAMNEVCAQKTKKTVSLFRLPSKSQVRNPSFNFKGQTVLEGSS